MDSPVPVKTKENGGLGRHLDCDFKRDSEPESPSLTAPIFLTHRNNKIQHYLLLETMF
jgi:hypothetical protein